MNMSCERALNLTNEKHFPKTISQWEFNYGLFTNLLRIIIPQDFSRVYSKSKEVSYLSWQNTYHNLKTTWHIKAKYFLWAKLVENLLLTKYLVSVTAPLMAIKNMPWTKKVNSFKIANVHPQDDA